jgi:zinc protease
MVPGTVDNDNAVVVQAPNLPSLTNFPLKRVLEERLGWPVVLENDAKNPGDLDYVEAQILAEIESLKTTPIPADELAAVKSHLRYQFALSMNSTSAIAGTLAHYLGLRRTPDTINKRYRLYDAVTPADIQATAQKYFTPEGQTIVRLGPAMDGMPAEEQ